MSSAPPFLREARFGYDLASPLQQAYERLTFNSALLPDDFTIASTTEIQRAVQNYDTTARVQTSGDFPTTVQTSNTYTLLNEGDDTAFDEIHQTNIRLDSIVDAILFNFAIGLNVTAASAGNFAIDSVTITMRSFKAQNQVAWSTILTVPSTLANISSAPDNQVLIVNYAYNTPFPLYAGGMLETQIVVNETTGTGTRQVGVLTLFPYQAGSTTKEISPSGFMMYYHNLLSQANSLTTGGYADYVTGGQTSQSAGLQPLGYVVPVEESALGGLN